MVGVVVHRRPEPVLERTWPDVPKELVPSEIVSDARLPKLKVVVVGVYIMLLATSTVDIVPDVLVAAKSG